MGVSDTGMHEVFTHGVLRKGFFVTSPKDASSEDEVVADLERVLTEHGHEIAAFVCEPRVQSAGGLIFYSIDLLQRMRQTCAAHDVLFIADEIATGFGRTGDLFGCTHQDEVVVPDILCLGKALTGGYVTMSAVLTSSKVARAVSGGDDGEVPFMHGPTFMANPLACAVSLASVTMLVENDFKYHANRVEKRLQKGLKCLEAEEHVVNVRTLGAIGAVELTAPLVGAEFQRVQREFVENGVWIRPFGRLIYTMPPFMVATDDEVDVICRAIRTVVKGLRGRV